MTVTTSRYIIIKNTALKRLVVYNDICCMICERRKQNKGLGSHNAPYKFGVNLC